MLFGSSGIRRKFDQNLVDIALKVGSVLATRSSTVIVGMDTRTTSPLLSHMVIAGLLGNGGTAYQAGVVPTPTVAFATRTVNAGCMITASHNPEEYNGLKLFNPDGSALTLLQQEQMEESLKNPPSLSDWEHQGTVTQIDAITPHKKAILNAVKIKRGLSVVLDCGSGAGSTFSPAMLTEAGVDLTCINCTPSGHFARPSEPLKENLLHVGEKVREEKAACAVVHDGDADRMMAFDNKGQYIGGDHLLMLFTQYLGVKKVVTTTDASMLIEEIAEVRRTPVGDTFVSEELLNWGDFGGETSGAWIFPKISLCPDGPYAAALFCEIASEWNIAETVAKMPTYPIHRESFLCETARQTVTALGAESPTDGIRVSDETGWYLIRASGTEPKIRITAEGKDNRSAKVMLERAREKIRQGKTD